MNQPRSLVMTPGWVKVANQIVTHPNFPRDAQPLMLFVQDHIGVEFVDLTANHVCEWLANAINADPRVIRLVLDQSPANPNAWTSSLETCLTLSFWRSEHGLGCVLAQILLHLWDEHDGVEVHP